MSYQNNENKVWIVISCGIDNASILILVEDTTKPGSHFLSYHLRTQMISIIFAPLDLL